MKVALIAAMGENRVIGAHGKVPWNMPSDAAYFLAHTADHVVIMGRKTFDSISHPLPWRESIVITSNTNFSAEGSMVIDSLQAAIANAQKIAPRKSEDDEIFVIGGATIYALALAGGYADTIYLTKIHASFEGDAFFPQFDESQWNMVSREEHTKDEKNPYDYTFLKYEKA